MAKNTVSTKVEVKAEEESSIFTTKIGDLAKSFGRKAKGVGVKVANSSIADLAGATKDGSGKVVSTTKSGYKSTMHKVADAAERRQLKGMIKDLQEQYDRTVNKTDKSTIRRSINTLNKKLEALQTNEEA